MTMPASTFVPPPMISFVATAAPVLRDDDGASSVLTNPTVFQPLIPEQKGEIYLDRARHQHSSLSPAREEAEHQPNTTSQQHQQPLLENGNNDIIMNSRNDAYCTDPPLPPEIVTTTPASALVVSDQQPRPIHQLPPPPMNQIPETCSQQLQREQEDQQHEQLHDRIEADHHSVQDSACTVTATNTSVSEAPGEGGSVDLDYHGTHKTYPREIGHIKQRRKRLTAVVGVVGGLVGLVSLGPVGGVAFGAGGAVATRTVAKRREKKKRQLLADREIARQHEGAPEVLCHKGVIT